jgi:hypothetical protein
VRRIDTPRITAKAKNAAAQNMEYRWRRSMERGHPLSTLIGMAVKNPYPVGLFFRYFFRSVGIGAGSGV